MHPNVLCNFIYLYQRHCPLASPCLRLKLYFIMIIKVKLRTDSCQKETQHNSSTSQRGWNHLSPTWQCKLSPDILKGAIGPFEVTSSSCKYGIVGKRIPALWTTGQKIIWCLAIDSRFLNTKGYQMKINEHTSKILPMHQPANNVMNGMFAV